MLDPKEEKRFEELRGMCRELKVPAPPEIMIGLQVHDKNGILTFDDVQRGHSWTRNYYNYWAFYGAHTTQSFVSFGAGYSSFKKQSTYIGGPGIPNLTQIGGIGSDAVGIVVGTGDTAFSIENYSLAAIVRHGGTGGTLAYAAQSAWSSSYAAKVWEGTSSRIFNNNSGGSITVKEVGMMAYCTSYMTNYDYTYLIERSVLSPTVAVANGAQLTVTYAISMDFSAID
jgi:hypothetical protein